MHKVWILDCKSCSTFLTNRAMKAVLLLRPSVPLYSTDALPVNCSAFSPTLPSTSTAPKVPIPVTPNPDTVRTCDCLTQTLCCHGCGTPVGYMIVVPCTRCTSSVLPPSPTPPAHLQHHPMGPLAHAAQGPGRATNGHRFVFHSSEIVAEERLYIEGEPGVDPDAQLLPPPPPLQPPPHVQIPFHQLHISHPNHHSSSPNPYTLPSAPTYTPAYHSPPLLPSYSYSYSYSNPFPLSHARHPYPHTPSNTDPHSPDLSQSPNMNPSLNRDPELDGLIASSNALFIHASATVDRARRILDRVQVANANTNATFTFNPNIPGNVNNTMNAGANSTISANGNAIDTRSHTPSFSHSSGSNFNSNNAYDYYPTASSPSPIPVLPHPHPHPHLNGQYVSFPLVRERAASVSVSPHHDIDSSNQLTAVRLSERDLNRRSSLSLTPPPLSPPPAPASPPPKLKQGDTLFWHHLIRRGELPGVEDDERARSSQQQKHQPHSLSGSGCEIDGHERSWSQMQAQNGCTEEDAGSIASGDVAARTESDLWCAR